jgi:hypothetical protein
MPPWTDDVHWIEAESERRLLIPTLLLQANASSSQSNANRYDDK